MRMEGDEPNPLERFLHPCSPKDREAAFKEISNFIQNVCTRFFVHSDIKYHLSVDDAVNECCVRLLQGRAAEYDAFMGYWKPYLEQLCRNTLLDICKKEKRQHNILEGDLHSNRLRHSDDPHYSFLQEDTFEGLRRRHGIPDRELTILRMLSEGHTLEETAQAVDLSKQRVSEVYRDLVLRLGTAFHAEEIIHLAPKAHLRRPYAEARQMAGFIATVQIKAKAGNLPQLPRPRREEARYICKHLGKQGIAHLIHIWTDHPGLLSIGGMPRLVGRVAMLEKERWPYPEFLEDITCASDAFRGYLGGASSIVTNPNCLALVHDLAGFLALSDPNSVVLQCIHHSSCFESSIREILYSYYLPYYEAFWSGQDFNTWLLNYWVDKTKKGCFDRSPYLAATQASLLRFLLEKSLR